MEALLPFLLLFFTTTTTTVLVAADASTNHYLRCLHESQCKKVVDGAYCCPSGTCCHFWMWESSKVMSVCKRIRPDQTLYCQDKDKVLLSDKNLLDSRFYDDPPNRGKVCLRRKWNDSVVCFGGTNSEEDEFKAKEGGTVTAEDAFKFLRGQTTNYEYVTGEMGMEKLRERIYYYATKSKENWFGKQ